MMRLILFYINWFLTGCCAVIALLMLSVSLGLKGTAGFHVEIWQFVIDIIIGLYFAGNAYFINTEKNKV